ncbi:unnamed protein product, partial [Mesorhabditis spiculigera]
MSDRYICGAELRRFVLLIVGCAVQSSRRKLFIHRIQKLDPRVQQGLARQIAKLTASSSQSCQLVCPRAWEVRPEITVDSGDYEVHQKDDATPPSPPATVVPLLLVLVERLALERDHLAAALLDMAHEHESDEGSSTTGTNSLNGDLPQRKPNGYDRRSPSPTILDRHTNVELASIKAELRRLRNDAEEKDEEVHLLQDELQLKEKEILKLNNERLELIQDARDARNLRDELEFLNQKVTKVDKLEQDNAKLREKLNELDYYKSRVQDLKKECEDLEESSRILECKMDEFRIKGKSMNEAEMRLADQQDSMKELHTEIAAKNSKIEKMLGDQTRMEKELADALARVAQLEKDNISVDGSPRLMPGSLADQMEESSRNEVAQLRLQNQKYRQQIESLEEQSRENSLSVSNVETESRLEECEKLLADQREENDRLNRQIGQLELHLELANSEKLQASDRSEALRIERDEVETTLREVRRNFATLQHDVEKKQVDTENANSKRLESECKEMCRQLEEMRLEVVEKERIIGRVREEQKSQRAEMDRLEDERKALETTNSQTDRQKRIAETERNALKEKLERLEDEVESSRFRLLSTEDARKRLESTERALVEAQNKSGDLEQENRALAHQLELESRKVQQLREDLVGEKSRVADLIGRLRSVCTGIAVNGGKIEADIDDAKLIESIDDVIMKALNAARREADTLRIQQHTQIAELADLRRDIEKLRRAENASLNESDDRVRELSKENANAKEQVFQLQERLRELQIEIATRSAETACAKREAEELRTTNVNLNKLHNELATLQVSLRNAQLQEELLKQDNEELRTQVDLSERMKREAKREADQIAALHQSLLSDHDRLQSLHDMLNHDYERAKADMAEAKRRARQQPTHEKFGQSVNAELEELRVALRQERTAHDRLLRQTAEGQNENGQMRRDIHAVRKENECLARNCDDLNAEIYKMRMADQAQKATIKNLNVSMESLSRQLEGKEVEMAKLRNRIEMLTQLNRTLEEENKNLGRQLEMLLQNNKDLLNRALNEKDIYHQEQRDFQEKLANLRRHKEKLEEKIMDQYKAMESKKSRDTKERTTLVKRAAKALIPKKSRSDKTSTGSTSTEDTLSSDEHGRLEEELAPTCSSSEDTDRISPRLFEQPFRASPSTSSPPPAPLQPFLRNRNDIIGGSVRLFPVVRRPLEDPRRALRPSGFSLQNNTVTTQRSAQPSPMAPRINTESPISQHQHERGVDIPTAGPALPPKIPVRNTANTQSLRARPPPPPYQSKLKAKPPPPYIQPKNTLQSDTISVNSMTFSPQMTSTPKSDRSGSGRIVKEGETRTFIRQKEERDQKAMSLYENVSREDLRDVSITTNTGATQSTDATSKAENGNESTVWYEYGCI